MRVGGAHFKVGLTRNEIKDDKNPTFALKILIFDVDSPETVDLICENISDILTEIDPNLDLIKTNGQQPSVN